MPNTALKPTRNNAGLVFGKGVWPGGLLWSLGLEENKS
jgi:hypothetical protein